MNDERGKKNSGRYIRNGDPILKHIQIEDFSFGAVAELETIEADNPLNSIIHADVHRKEKLSRTLKDSREIRANLEPGVKRIILYPVDFTDDWKRMRERQRSRQGRYEDDEEIEMEREYILNKQRERKRLGLTKTDEDDKTEIMDEVEKAVAEEDQAGETVSLPAEHQREIMEIIEEKDEAPQILEAKPTTAEPDNAPNVEINDNHSEIHKESINEATKALNDVADVNSKMKSNLDEISTNPVISQDVGDSAAPVSKWTPKSESSFRPFKTYSDQETMSKISEKQSQLVEELKAKGYEDGFKVGEEKAALQLKNNYQELAKKLMVLIGELEGLKKNVLQNSQENFLILCQSMMEGLLRREFYVNRDSFASMISRAIREAVPDDKFRIHVNPEMADGLRDLLDDSLKNRIESDEKIPEGDFRIESGLTVIDGNMSEMVKDLFKNANLDLFEVEKDKAG
ncbi:MAG: hypothetical protein HQK54_02800 [Oligoflexales bacterium]|nr:hypothetical protein [Oligoflexales bacterium]